MSPLLLPSLLRDLCPLPRDTTSSSLGSHGAGTGPWGREDTRVSLGQGGRGIERPPFSGVALRTPWFKETWLLGSHPAAGFLHTIRASFSPSAWGICPRWGPEACAVCPVLKEAAVGQWVLDAVPVALVQDRKLGQLSRLGCRAAQERCGEGGSCRTRHSAPAAPSSSPAAAGWRVAVLRPRPPFCSWCPRRRRPENSCR